MHVEVLLLLFDTDAPRVVYIKPTDKNKLKYMGGDASAEGFGSMTQYPGLLIAGRNGLQDPVFSGKGSNSRSAVSGQPSAPGDQSWRA